MSLTVMKGVKYTEKRARQWLEQDCAVIAQIKRDEIRCTVEVCIDGTVVYTSASGKPLYNLGCFDTHWRNVELQFKQGTYDSGVCVNESFDLTRRTVMASKKKYDLSGKTEHHILDKKTGSEYKGNLRAFFYLYDLPTLKESYFDRRILMAYMHAQFPEILRCPETWVVMPQVMGDIDGAIKELDSLFEQATNNMHEGLMVKRVEFEYKEGRTTDWMKMKPEEEADGVITGYNPGYGKYAGQIGSINVTFEDGSKCAVSGISDGMRMDFTRNGAEYIGCAVEIRYMHRDSDGGYRHPRFYRFHPDK